MLLNKSENFFEIGIDLDVKTYDIDFAGIVSNIVYVRWLEDLRLAMMAAYYPLGKQLEQGFAPAILQTKIDYKQPIKMCDTVFGRMWISEIDSIRWIVKAEIYVHNKVVAIAEQTGLFVKIPCMRPILLPDELAQKYSEYHKSLIPI
ncbi:acyl-CoA thioesterase [Nostoc sp. WHI]|uniref:acyl-CoA thioesterase n=1 Tax=Nostoc sp. WHI TaxID=2650611 RepID=UPI0018C51934|nr:thioesterase family protein [Nostoc sp. WHI]MBG1271049.1 acyl-CoA thioesterase [Nostoc sp. WHI]